MAYLSANEKNYAVIATILSLVALAPLPSLGAEAIKNRPALCRIVRGDGMLTALGGYSEVPLYNDFPMAFSETGNVYVLDAIGNKLFVGKVAGAEGSCTVAEVPLSLKSAKQARGIYFVGAHLFLLGSAGNAIEIGEDGAEKSRRERRTPGEGSLTAGSGAEATARAQMLLAAPILLDHKGIVPSKLGGAAKSPGEIGTAISENRRLAGQVRPLVRAFNGSNYEYEVSLIGSRNASITLYFGAQAKLFKVSVPHRLGSVEIFGIDSDEKIYVASEDVWLDEGKAIHVNWQIDAIAERDGRVATATVEFPRPGRSDVEAVNQPPAVQYGVENVVKIPVLTKRALEIERLPLHQVDDTIKSSSTSDSKLEDWDGTLSEQQKSMVERAESFLTLEWTLTPTSVGSGSSEKCDPPGSMYLRPAFLRDAMQGSNIYGVPYMWGGKDSLPSISSRLRSGAIAGNICCKTYVDSKTHESVPTVLTGATGIDCSGFVSRVWDLRGDLANSSTTALVKKSTILSGLDKLQAGDALDKPNSHIRLFMGWINSSHGRLLRAYESTASTICSGVCLRDLPARAYVGYIPIRRNSSAPPGPPEVPEG
jgi:hypothetical protein